MASTPPPPRRIHTPPTPLHGPKFDNYEPYSPRRSTRVAAQHSKTTPSPRFGSSPLRNATVTTPPATLRVARTRRTDNSQAFSPPSSAPRSPVAPSTIKRSRTRGSPVPASDDSDTDILPGKETLQHRRTSSKDTFGMLNSPAKTPSRKRKDTNGNSAARLLFGDNDGLLHPTPRKQRSGMKARMNLFGDLEDDVTSTRSGGIQIYTDSKERVPSLGDDEEANPFLTKNAAPMKKTGKAKRRTSAEKERDDEGMVYVFRGKKIFRKFETPGMHQTPSSPTTAAAVADESDNLSDIELRRKAGPAASTRFTRSAVKPRLLFPTEAQRREREEEADADEEALTDIEMPRPTNKPATPTKSKVAEEPEEQLQNELEDAALAVPTPSFVPEVKVTRKRGAFDGFQRRKAGVGVIGGLTGKGVKREASPGLVGDAKRTRSGAFP